MRRRESFFSDPHWNLALGAGAVASEAPHTFEICVDDGCAYVSQFIERPPLRGFAVELLPCADASGRVDVASFILAAWRRKTCSSLVSQFVRFVARCVEQQWSLRDWPSDPFVAHRMIRRGARKGEVLKESLAFARVGGEVASSTSDVARVLKGLGMSSGSGADACTGPLLRYFLATRRDFSKVGTLHLATDAGEAGGRKWCFTVAQAKLDNGEVRAAVLCPCVRTDQMLSACNRLAYVSWARAKISLACFQIFSDLVWKCSRLAF